MLVQVEHILDDANVLIDGETRADREHVAQVLLTLSGRAFLPLSLRALIVRSLLLVLVVVALILAVGVATASLTSRLLLTISFVSLRRSRLIGGLRGGIWGALGLRL